MSNNKRPALDFQNLFGDLVRDVRELISPGGALLNILEFIDEEVNLGIKLTLQQNLVLKVLYNLPLTDEDISVLEFWKAAERSTWAPDQHYQTLILESGRRSGKTNLAALICAYEFYKLCKMNSPQIHYNIATSTPIAILVIATTADQAKKTIFRNVIGVINNSPYFQALVDQGKLFVGKEEVSYEEKLLYIYSGNSRSGAQVGGTLKCLVMDEVARFQDSDGHSNAIELWSNLGISCAPFGTEAIRVAISSAWYKGDAIEKLYASTAEDSTAIGIKSRSWDLNPIHAARDNPVVASEYVRDPVQAGIEFEGIRPEAVDAYLDADEVKDCFRTPSAVSASVYTSNTSPKLVCMHLGSIEPKPHPTVIHIDPAFANDAYALAMGYNDFDDTGRSIVTIDAVLAWEPTPEAQVSITNVVDTILEIARYRHIVKVTADHYNSTETIQRLRLQGINAETVYFSNSKQFEMYKLVKELMHESRLLLPQQSPWKPLVLRELSQVQLIKGTKIDHPKDGSKDTADAIAAVAHQLSLRLAYDAPKTTRRPAASSASAPPVGAFGQTGFGAKRVQALAALMRRSQARRR